MTSVPKTVVIKIGGSLLLLPDLAARLQCLLRQRDQEQCLIVVGGGEAADIVRSWSQVHAISDEAAHWLAISSMGLNREFLEQLLSLRTVCSREAADLAWAEDCGPLLLDMKKFALQEEGEISEPLPHRWDVTSDSLAAWVAVRWPADELILAKSVPCPAEPCSLDASRKQFVDDYFPMLSGQLPQVTWCDLRADEPGIVRWL